MANNHEQRRLERKSIDQLVNVKDSLLDLDVGRVVNMHEEGFMLIGNGQIRENCLYQLQLSLSQEVAGRNQFSLGAECLWVKSTDSGTQYWAGFHIIDLAEQDRAIILELIHQIA